MKPKNGSNMGNLKTFGNCIVKIYPIVISAKGVVSNKKIFEELALPNKLIRIRKKKQFYYKRATSYPSFSINGYRKCRVGKEELAPESPVGI